MPKISFSNLHVFLILLTCLTCLFLTSCQTPEPPAPTPAPAVSMENLPENSVLSAYAPEGTGTKELFYNERLQFCIREYESSSALICREQVTDGWNEWELDKLDYNSSNPRWDTVQLYPFTDILGCDGFVFAHGDSAAFLSYDFYEVYDTGALPVAHCENTMYTADLNGDGRLELLTNYHNFGYLDLFWAEENGMICSCSLNETARDMLGLPLDIGRPSLRVQEGNCELLANWPAEDGAGWCTLDAVSLWEWEKNRTEFWDIVYLHTADKRDITVRLKESRSRPEDLPLFENHYRIDEIQVYHEKTLIQTILPEDLSYNGDYLFEGLFAVYGGGVPGKPEIKDYNFDGSDDLGLMAADCFPHNVSYCYFLWDSEKEQLSTDFFVLFAPLGLDAENRMLIEQAKGEKDRYYRFDSENHLIRLIQYTA